MTTFEVFIGKGHGRGRKPRRTPSGLPAARIAVSLDPVVLEALDETARELTVHRSILIERALEDYLERLELPPRP